MADAYHECDRHQFSLILLDLNMPGSNGVMGLPEFCRHTGVPVLVVSADNRIETIQMAAKQGVIGYLPKSADSQIIPSILDKVLSGEKYFPEEALQALELSGKVSLNSRQIKVLECLIDGLSNRDIADKVNLSEGTVRQYVTIILRYLGVGNRTQAANEGRKLLQELTTL